MGGGDYSTLFDATASSTISVTPDGEGSYTLAAVGFGKVQVDGTGVPTDGYWQPLGYPNIRADAILATNFVGLGLPSYIWYQVTNLLYKVDLNFDQNIVCDNNIGGLCTL